MADIQRAFGPDTSAAGIKKCIDRYFKPCGSLINKTLAEGGNLKNLDIFQYFSDQSRTKNKGKNF